MALFFGIIIPWAADQSTPATVFGIGYYNRRRRFMTYCLE